MDWSENAELFIRYSYSIEDSLRIFSEFTKNFWMSRKLSFNFFWGFFLSEV